MSKKKFSWGPFFAGVGSVLGLNLVIAGVMYYRAKKAAEPKVATIAVGSIN